MRCLEDPIGYLDIKIAANFFLTRWVGWGVQDTVVKVYSGPSLCMTSPCDRNGWIILGIRAERVVIAGRSSLLASWHLRLHGFVLISSCLLGHRSSKMSCQLTYLLERQGVLLHYALCSIVIFAACFLVLKPYKSLNFGKRVLSNAIHVRRMLSS